MNDVPLQYPSVIYNETDKECGAVIDHRRDQSLNHKVTAIYLALHLDTEDFKI